MSVRSSCRSACFYEAAGAVLTADFAGRVGIRNHALVMATCACSSDTARLIEEKVPGTVTFHNQHGCGQPPLDLELTLRIMSGAAANGNIYGVVLVALGCESAQCPLVEERIREKTDKPVYSVSIQEEGGTVKAVERGAEYAERLAAAAAACGRVPCDVSELILGTECGGSDPTSGLFRQSGHGAGIGPAGGSRRHLDLK